MPPLPRRTPSSASKKEKKQTAGDKYLEEQAAMANDPNSIGNILYDVFCPRLPDEGFFGPLNLPYVTPHGAKNIRKFKYSGADHSLTYKYVLSPMAEFAVQLLPRSVAPNLITMTALWISIYNHIVIAYYSWDFTQDIPAWVWLQNAICLLVYQLLDNMDGKQARRTNTSSPLGMLFDHGCDAFNSGMMAMNNMALFKFGNNPTRAIWSYFCLITTFLLSTWEEFFAGSLELPFPNGPSEGIIINAGLSLMAYALGSGYKEFFLQEVSFLGNLTLEDILMIVYSIAALGTLFHNVTAVDKALRPKTDASSKKQVRELRRRDAFGAVVPLLFGHVLAIFILYFPDTSLFLDHQRVFTSLLGIIFANLAIHLQLAHIQHMTFYPWRKSFIVPMVVLTFNAVLRYNGIHLVDQGLLLYCCFAGAGLSFLQFTFRVVVEVSNSLGIYVFTQPSPSKTK